MVETVLRKKIHFITIILLGYFQDLTWIWALIGILININFWLIKTSFIKLREKRGKKVVLISPKSSVKRHFVCRTRRARACVRCAAAWRRRGGGDVIGWERRALKAEETRLRILLHPQPRRAGASGTLPGYHRHSTTDIYTHPKSMRDGNTAGGF